MKVKKFQNHLIQKSDLLPFNDFFLLEIFFLKKKISIFLTFVLRDKVSFLQFFLNFTSIPFGSAKGVMADFGSRHDFQST